MKTIIKNWGETQGCNIVTQLRHGVRYFDLRVEYNVPSDDFLIVHTLLGLQVFGMLKEMQTFLAENPKEVIIIGFNSFINFKESAIHDRFADKIKEIFQGMIFTNDEAKETLTSSLSELWESGKQVIIRYKSNSQFVPKEFWRLNLITDVFYNASKASQLKPELTDNITRNETGKFNVFQAILTPQWWTVFFNLTSSLKNNLAGKSHKAVKEWLGWVNERQKVEREQHIVNIVMCDYICLAKIVPEILKLNENIPKN